MCIASLNCVFYQPKDRNKNDSSRVITATQAVNPFPPTFARTSQGNTIITKKERLELTKTNVLNTFNNISQKEDTDQFFGLTRRSYLPKNCYAKMSSNGRSRFVFISLPTFICNEIFKLNGFFFPLQE